MADIPGQALTAATRGRAADDLRALGVTTGQVLLVHASLRTMGWVPGGAATVVAADQRRHRLRGTLVTPAETPGNSDSSRLYHWPGRCDMTGDEVTRYQASMPPFDPASTPSEGMGCIAEYVRTTPGVIRSAHPQSSFAAVGPMAHKIMDEHAINCHLR